MPGHDSAPSAQNVTAATRRAQPHYRVTDAGTRSQIHTSEGCFLSGEEQSYTPRALSLISGNIALPTERRGLDIRHELSFSLSSSFSHLTTLHLPLFLARLYALSGGISPTTRIGKLLMCPRYARLRLPSKYGTSLIPERWRVKIRLPLPREVDQHGIEK